MELAVAGLADGPPHPSLANAAMAWLVEAILVVGVEADHLDVLARELPPEVRVGLVTYRL